MDQEDATTIVSTPSHVKFKDYNPLPGSTGEADGGIQSLRFHFTKNSGNSVPVEKLAGYRREDYELLLYDIRAGNVTALRRAI